MRKTTVLALAVLLLGQAACTTSSRKAAQAVYDLGAPAGGQGPVAEGIPLMMEVRASRWFDSPGIQYRLAYADPARLHSYAQARWAASPAILLRQRLAQQLGLMSLGQGRAACALHVDIDEFTQVFDGPELSRGVLRARLAVLDGARNRLAEHSLAIEKPAPSANSSGAVAALGAAVDQLLGDISRWRGGLAGSGRLKACEK